MIHTKLFPQSISVKVQPFAEDYLEYSRILAAATINPKFCNALLADPYLALQDGYKGETFQLSDDGWTWLLSQTVNSLPELACQLAPVQEMETQLSSTGFAQPPDIFEL